MDKIRVLIVDDSEITVKVIREVLEHDPKLEIAGVAANGREAVDRAAALKPDIIIMDIAMPVMDGYEATEKIMSETPVPILIMSSSIYSSADSDKIFRAISLGALDVMDKKVLENRPGHKNDLKDFLEKVKFLSRIKVIRHPLAKLKSGRLPVLADEKKDGKIVGIAVSTGGPSALKLLLSGLPKTFPCAILIVQHISSGFTDGLVRWLSSEIQINVKTAQTGELILPGTAYIAPNDYQMKIGTDRRIILADDPPFHGHRPSGTVLLKSIAEVCGKNAIGVVLTGMGEDGAAGAKKIAEAGGFVIAQDEESSVVFGMPRSTIEAGAASVVLPLYLISEEILRRVE